MDSLKHKSFKVRFRSDKVPSHGVGTTPNLFILSINWVFLQRTPHNWETGKRRLPEGQ